MDLVSFLRGRKTPVLERWFDLIAQTYPPEIAQALKRGGDRFSNPMVSTISEGIEALYNGILSEMEPEKIASSLDWVIRLRAVQGLSPSQAVSFIFFLKKAIREELERIKDPPLKELLKIEDKIDKIALLAFDIYISCREKIYQIREESLKAEKRMLSRLLGDR